MKKCQIEYVKEKNIMINYLFFSIMIFMNIIGYCYTRKGNFYNLYLSFIRIVCYLFHYKLQSFNFIYTYTYTYKFYKK